MQQSVYETFVVEIIHTTFFAPVGFLALMFLFQIIHWVVAWVDDSDIVKTNLVMQWTMIHIFGYHINTNNDCHGRSVGLFGKDIDGVYHASDGALAIFVTPIALAMLPMVVATIAEYWVVLGFVAMAIAFMFGLRGLRRLSKVVSIHVNDNNAHDRRNK